MTVSVFRDHGTYDEAGELSFVVDGEEIVMVLSWGERIRFNIQAADKLASLLLKSGDTASKARDRKFARHEPAAYRSAAMSRGRHG